MIEMLLGLIIGAAILGIVMLIGWALASGAARSEREARERRWYGEN